MKEISNEKIYLEILRIKKLMQQSLDLQKEEISLDEEIKLFEGRQADEEAKLASEIKKKKFNSVFDWKGAIWDNCPHKKDKVTDSTITFYCNITNNICKFNTCPRNNKEE